MLFRQIQPHEVKPVYEMGYKEWSKGRTYETYVKENQKEEDYGTRYVYADENNNMIGSLIVLHLQLKIPNQPLPLYGLGSIVIDKAFRGRGYGKQLLYECLSYIEGQHSNTTFILYSDIAPDFYYTFGFKELPVQQQRYTKSICMVRCSQPIYEFIIKQPLSCIPSYF